jgi:hypothetical protein
VGRWTADRQRDGPFFFFAMVYSRAEDASEFAAAVAKEQWLVCFDPQTGKVRT